MAITTAEFNDLVKNALVQWQTARDEFPSVRNELMNVKNIAVKTSEHSSITSLPTARRQSEGNDAYLGEPKQGFAKTFTQADIAIEADVTEQLRRYDQYDEIMKRMRGLGRSVERRIEMDCGSLLSYAWSTTYANIDGETVTVSTPDGSALIASAHTLNGSSTTWSNYLTADSAISQSTLEDLENLFNGFLDDDGRLIPIMPDAIITGQHSPTVFEVQRLLKSVQESGSAQNDVNVHKGQYKHLVVPFLDVTHATEARDSTKNKYVFLAALGNKDDNGFILEMSLAPRFLPPEQVFSSGTWKFLSKAAYDFGTIRPQFIAGTKGTA